jgi:hypothetical protein
MSVVTSRPVPLSGGVFDFTNKSLSVKFSEGWLTAIRDRGHVNKAA